MCFLSQITGEYLYRFIAQQQRVYLFVTVKSDMNNIHQFSITTMTNSTNSTEFMDLPNEVQAEIYKNLQPKERQQLRIVSFRMANIINHYFGIGIRIDNDNYTLMTLSDSAVEAKFANFTRNIPYPFLSANILQKLEIERIMASYNLMDILHQCPNLKEILFSNILLEKNKPLPISEGCQLLSKLRKIDIRISSKQYAFGPSDCVILHLLRDCRLDKMTDLNIYSVTAMPYFEDHFGQTFPFGIEVHPETTESQILVDIIIQNRRCLKRLNVEYITRLIDLNERTTEWFEIQLEELCMAGKMEPSKWNVVLQAQNVLKKLIICIPPEMYKDVQDAIIRCSATITNISLSIEDESEDNLLPELDLSYMQGCKNLKILQFFCPGSLKLINSLPSSLRRLNLDSRVAKDSWIQMLVNTIHLTEIYYSMSSIFTSILRVATGPQENNNPWLLDLEIVKTMLSCPNIKILTFRSGCFFDYDSVPKWCKSNKGLQTTFTDFRKSFGTNDQLPEESAGIYDLRIKVLEGYVRPSLSV